MSVYTVPYMLHLVAFATAGSRNKDDRAVFYAELFFFVCVAS